MDSSNEDDDPNEKGMHTGTFTWSIADLSNVTGSCTWDPIVHAATSAASVAASVSASVLVIAAIALLV